MANELDTLVVAIEAKLDLLEDVHVVHTELPPVLTDPPEAWVKIGSGSASAYEFGQEAETHEIEVWIWVGLSAHGDNEQTIRRLWHTILRAIAADESFGGACEGIYEPITYTTGWQAVGGPQYRKMEIVIPCVITVVAYG